MSQRPELGDTEFTAMRDATREDYQKIARHSMDFLQTYPIVFSSTLRF